MHRYVNSVLSKITGNSGKSFDEEKARKEFQNSFTEDKSGNPKLDEDRFLDLLDNFWLKAKIAGMKEERAKGESSDNLYNIAAVGMLASALNTILLIAVVYSIYG